MTVEDAINKMENFAKSIDELGNSSGFREIVTMLKELKKYKESNLVCIEDIIEDFQLIVELCKENKLESEANSYRLAIDFIKHKYVGE